MPALNSEKDIGLFGEIALPYKRKRHETMLQYWARVAGYKKSNDKERCCGNCHYLCAVKYSRTYYKCRAFSCSSSQATDIRLGHVCMYFRKDGTDVYVTKDAVDEVINHIKEGGK